MTDFDCFVFALEAAGAIAVALTVGYFLFVALAKLKWATSRRARR